MGYSFKASSDSEIQIKDGDDATADGVIFLLLLEGQSVRDLFDPSIEFINGIYVDVVSGDVEGSVWTEQ